MRVPPLLEVKNLTKVFSSSGIRKKRSLKVVDNISFEIHGDEATITALAGESGSGKTTTSRMILGLVKPTSGEVFFEGIDVLKMSKKEKWNSKRQMQAIFQDPYGSYNPFYRVDRVLETPIKKFHLASSKEQAFQMIADALESVSIVPREVLGKYPHQLSGGQKQRIMIARALLTKPRLIIADEPVSMIDASLRASILNVFLDLKKKYGMSILYITHDLSTASYICDDIVIFYNGGVMEQGSIDAVTTKPAHPYTQLLVKCVPLPDPDRKWEETTDLKVCEDTRTEESYLGCKFYSRCPRSMQKCKEVNPQLTSLQENHQVACHLYSTEA